MVRLPVILCIFYLAILGDQAPGLTGWGFRAIRISAKYVIDKYRKHLISPAVENGLLGPPGNGFIFHLRNSLFADTLCDFVRADVGPILFGSPLVSLVYGFADCSSRGAFISAWLSSSPPSDRFLSRSSRIDRDFFCAHFCAQSLARGSVGLLRAFGDDNWQFAIDFSTLVQSSRLPRLSS